MNKLFAFTRASLAFAFLAAAGGPAVAETETYEKPALMYVILAKVWGEVCPDVVLTESEASEIQAFIDLWVFTQDGEGDRWQPARRLAKDLERTYLDTYRVPGKCGEIEPGAVQAILHKIRMATADPAFWAELGDA